MRRRSLAACLCSVIVLLPWRSAAREPPKLLVLVSIDQLGATYFDRYGSVMTGGLKTLQRRGIFLSNVVFADANTETAPGHATIATGAWPNMHGMVANYWFDLRSMRRINCVEDLDFGRSSKNLMLPGIADAIRVATRGKSKTISVGLKDRSTIILGGERPTAAIWYELETGRFISGKWYRATEKSVEPEAAWISAATSKLGAESAFNTTWTKVAPDLDYAALAGPDDDVVEANLPGVGRTFPHALGRDLENATGPEWRNHYPITPSSIDAVFSLAERALLEEKLGRHDTIDMLAVSVSTLDYVGHWFGPGSQEALDTVIRVDRALDKLVAKVDREVGPRNVLWIVTADHGIVDPPEHMRELGVRAARINQRDMAAAINDALKVMAGKNPPPRVFDINSPRIVLEFPDPKVDKLAYRREAARVLRERPEIVDARASEDAKELREPFRELAERILYPGREPDVVFIQRPYDVIEPENPTGGVGSAHGTPYAYDATVTVIAAGPGVARGEDRAKYEMTRLAPAIALLLGIAPPPAAFDAPLPIVENQ